MSDSFENHLPTDGTAAPQGNVAQQVMNGEVRTHPIIQDTKSEFKGLASGPEDGEDGEQPQTFYHSLFAELFTWKYPKATGLVFVSVISLIFAFRYVNVLRYVFKATYMLFASVAVLELASKPLGSRGLVSSMRPRRYYTIPRDSLERLFAQLHEISNFFVLEFQRVLFVENIFATLVAFAASFFGYFLIKYIPLWGLLLLATVTAFTAPLIYLNNQEVIDEKIRQASEFANAQLESGKKVSEKYAGDAIARAQATAADLSQKVQGYTGSRKSPSPVASKSPEPATREPIIKTEPADSVTRDAYSDLKDAPAPPTTLNNDFPSAPNHEPSTHEEEPLME